MNQEINFIPLDYDYFDFQGRNYLKITGRTDKNKRVCIVDSYEPYFWAILKENTNEKKKIYPEDLLEADGVIITNSLLGAVPAICLDGKELSDSSELCKKINMELF